MLPYLADMVGNINRKKYSKKNDLEKIHRLHLLHENLEN